MTVIYCLALLALVAMAEQQPTQQYSSAFEYLKGEWKTDPLPSDHILGHEGNIGVTLALESAVYEGVLLGNIYRTSDLMIDPTALSEGKVLTSLAKFHFEEATPTTGTFRLEPEEADYTTAYSFILSTETQTYRVNGTLGSSPERSFRYDFAELHRGVFTLHVFCVGTLCTPADSFILSGRKVRTTEVSDDENSLQTWLKFTLALVVFIRILCYVFLPKDKKRKITTQSFRTMENMRQDIVRQYAIDNATETLASLIAEQAKAKGEDTL